MIIEGIIGFALWILEMVFAGFSAVSLPYNLLSAVFDIMKFGAWVIGSDLLSIVITNVFFWLGFKFSAGLVLFIYRLIPLT